MKFTAQQIASVLDGKIDGNPEIEVSDFTRIEEGKPGTLTFLHNPKYEHFLYGTEASICIVNQDFNPKRPVNATLIKVDNAYLALTRLLEYYDQMKSRKSGIEEPVYIAESAQYGEAVYLGAFAYLGEGVEIGNHVKIYPHAYIGDNSKIGDHTIIYSGAKLYKESQIGKNCIIHSNAVIGADGFGFAPDEKGVYSKIPQIGNVILEDHVEIGAGTTIDRSTMGSTVIHEGVKLDNQVQVAHNVTVGAHTVIASQTGIAGSTKIGKHNVIGGQAGIAGHIKIGDKVQIQAQSGISKNLEEGAAVQGSPAFAYSDYFRSYVHFKHLPKIVNRLNELEKKLNQNG